MNTLLGVMASINTHENMEGLEPGVNGCDPFRPVSNANEGDEPSLEFWMVIWYLSGNVGCKSKDPKSMNSSCQIVVLILAKTRASTGKFTDVNTTVGLKCIPKLSGLRG